MLENKSIIIGESIPKVKIKKEIIIILDCMLNKDEMKCSTCEQVYTCCYLTEAVITYQSKETFKKENV